MEKGSGILLLLLPSPPACRTETIYNLQGVSGLMQRIMDTWKMLDKNDDGEPMSRLHSLDTLTCMHVVH